jgi:hypothetical protein
MVIPEIKGHAHTGPSPMLAGLTHLARGGLPMGPAEAP